MQILKNSRRSKITGDFGEVLVLYWLSKYAFECARMDHTEIDIIARDPHTGERLGVAVKSKSQNVSKAETYLAREGDYLVKAQGAFDAYGCKPCLAIVVDAASAIHCYLLTMAHLLQLFRVRTSGGWKMWNKCFNSYKQDPEITGFELYAETKRW